MRWTVGSTLAVHRPRGCCPRGRTDVHGTCRAAGGLITIASANQRPTAVATYSLIVPIGAGGGDGATSADAKLGPTAPGTVAAGKIAIGTCAARSRFKIVNSSALRTPAAMRGPETYAMAWKISSPF